MSKTDTDIPVEELPFEEAMVALTDTVMQLEAGELTLEASLALFQKGQALSARCQTLLESAVLQVEQLSADGEIISRNME